MDEGPKTSLYLDERPVFIQIIQDAPDQGVIAQIKNELPPVPETLAEPGKKHARKIACGRAHLRPHIHENGIAPYNREKERQPVKPQNIRQHVKQGQKKITPAGGPQNHGTGEQLLDHGEIKAPEIPQRQTGQPGGSQTEQLFPVPLDLL